MICVFDVDLELTSPPGVGKIGGPPINPMGKNAAAHIGSSLLLPKSLTVCTVSWLAFLTKKSTSDHTLRSVLLLLLACSEFTARTECSLRKNSVQPRAGGAKNVAKDKKQLDFKSTKGENKED